MKMRMRRHDAASGASGDCANKLSSVFIEGAYAVASVWRGAPSIAHSRPCRSRTSSN
jgi:hypothetical protein